MDRDDLLRTLRAALATDLADQVPVLERGLVQLEREPDGDARAGLLRDLFRAAHGLKGSARAAGLARVEATCHSMESLLGDARDRGRALVREDFAALLAGVDALADAQRRLAEGPDAAVDDAPFERAIEALASRQEMGAVDAVITDAPPPSLPATATPTPTPTPTATSAPTPTATSASTSTPTPPTTTTATSATPSTPPPPPRRPGSFRLAPERLDALAAAGGALLAAAHQAETRAGRVDELAREARRLRIRLRGGRPALTRAAAAARAARATADARAADVALSVEDDLHRLERALATLRAQLALEGRALSRRTQRLAAEVRGLRLTPWAEATAGLERTARDVAAAGGKDVEVVVAGEGLELDRSVVDALRDPLGQLVRNAVDHGLEPPAERAAAGKPARGRVEVAAAVDGERIRVTVSDDGRGLDPERLRDEARRRGIAAPADARRALELVFLPGFSTAREVTEVSGRGVGLDVVQSAVRAMRGTIRVSSQPRRGTTFELDVPTTLYGLRALLARDADQVFAVPALDVERVVRLSPDRVATSGGRPVLLAGAPVPLAPLGHALGLAHGAWSPDGWRMAVVLATDGDRAAFAVQEVVQERELSLEPLTGRLEGLPLASAVATLPGGGLAVVLAASELVQAAHGGPVHATAAAAKAERPARRILLADDAATTRALTRSILEASGYEVLQAADGEQAWALLQQQGADVVLSDVEMPRMNGFDLTRAIRQSPRFARLPVVLLTALEDEADRRRGLEAGADAYLVKSGFDQRVLVDTLNELLEEVP